MPTHFAYLKRITPAYWRFEPDSRYLRVNSLKKCSLLASSKFQSRLWSRQT